jgi:hypothetical protein
MEHRPTHIAILLILGTGLLRAQQDYYDAQPYWIEQHWKPGQTLNAVYKQFDYNIPGQDRNVWAVGDDGVVLRSTDGGMSWIETVLDPTLNLTDIYFNDQVLARWPDDRLGWITGYRKTDGAPALFRSTDDGTTWVDWTSYLFPSQYLPTLRTPLLGTVFAKPTHGRITSAHGASGSLKTAATVGSPRSCLRSSVQGLLKTRTTSPTPWVRKSGTGVLLLRIPTLSRIPTGLLSAATSGVRLSSALIRICLNRSTLTPRPWPM